MLTLANVTASSKTIGPCLLVFIFTDPQILTAEFICKYREKYFVYVLHGEIWCYKIVIAHINLIINSIIL